jgi:stage IV sporulation protein FB
VFLKLKQTKKRQPTDCRSVYQKPKQTPFQLFRIHPLFLLAGVWYSFTGELFLFLMSAIVAIQHECAHAFAAAKLGYKLNKIVLMPFGAIIDGDMSGISFKDELLVAACGPLCNLCTAIFFIALWWLKPTMYAFTDTACYASLSIAFINLLPAYPLDGGRILKSALCRFFLKKNSEERVALKKAEGICRGVTFGFAGILLTVFFILLARTVLNFTLLAFGIFLLVGGIGNRADRAVYTKMDFSKNNALEKGIEIRRIAVRDSCPIKNALRFLSREYYLVLEIYDSQERHLFNLTQNELSDLFLLSNSPYESLALLQKRGEKNKNTAYFITEKADFL